ncbi:MAG: hypothetical protein FWF50_04920 [Defluviitaleaceae bacterium]|nr:hypothetical protein [Defluviitaleaceae bacterium]
MKDIFKEQIIKKDMEPKDFIKIGIFSMLALLPIAFLALIIPQATLFLFILWGYLIFLIYSRSKIEYEYSVTNAELDIDIIYNKRKRKHLININLEKIEYLASIDYKPSSNENGKITNEAKLKTKNFSKKNGTHFIIHTSNGVKTKIIFEPNEEILAAMLRKIKKKYLT